MKLHLSDPYRASLNVPAQNVDRPRLGRIRTREADKTLRMRRLKARAIPVPSQTRQHPAFPGEENRLRDSVLGLMCDKLLGSSAAVKNVLVDVDDSLVLFLGVQERRPKETAEEFPTCKR